MTASSKTILSLEKTEASKYNFLRDKFKNQKLNMAFF